MTSLALPATTLHDHLRQATAARHHRLDSALGAADRFADRAAYRCFLRCAFLFQSSVERALERAGVAGFIPDWPRRRRVALVERDLATLGAQRPADSAVPPFSVAREEAAVLGTAYVLEGATLGGQMLLSRIRRLGFHALHGGAFLNGYGAAHAGMWRGFLELLATRDAAGLPRAAARTAACEVFDLAAEIYGADVAS